MRNLLIPGILICCLEIISCKQKPIQSQNYLAGRLTSTDTFIGHYSNKPVGSKSVYLRKYNDTLNYYLKAITDKDGYFTFNLKPNDTGSYIYYFSDSIDNLVFADSQIQNLIGDAIVQLTNLKLNAVPAAKNKAVLFNVLDTGFIPVAKATIAVYSSQFLADSNDVSTALFTLTTDAQGKAFQLAMKPGTYYFNAFLKVKDSTYISSGNSFDFLLTDSFKYLPTIQLPF